MAKNTFKTPGVYIVEQEAFRGSVVALQSDVPVFIGYTETAQSANGVNLNYRPHRISSYAEYRECFGGAFNPVFSVTEKVDTEDKKKEFDVKHKEGNVLYMYSAVHLFFLNSGGSCYIMSVGTYGGKNKLLINPADYNQHNKSVWDVLKNELEPTLVVLPDVIALGVSAYKDFYQEALDHCALTQGRFCIFDVHQADLEKYDREDAEKFREGIGVHSLNYCAAYYPWLHSTIHSAADVDFENIDDFVSVIPALPEFSAAADPAVKETLLLLSKFVNEHSTTDKNDQSELPAKSADKKMIHERLKKISPSYESLLTKILRLMNIVPPSGPIAGVYCAVDQGRGVWRAPANVSINGISAPTISISRDEKDFLVIDTAGKSINMILPQDFFGNLVWSARTLDGNSLDWRYVNVRRTMIMIEQSIKLAIRAHVFEPNNSITWNAVKSMIDNFLDTLWGQGALAGPEPDECFDVMVGLGSTMTDNDILNGVLRIQVKVALVRPAEFIEISFQQMQQLS